MKQLPAGRIYLEYTQILIAHKVFDDMIPRQTINVVCPWDDQLIYANLCHKYIFPRLLSGVINHTARQ